MTQSDPVTTILDLLYTRMQIDDEWATRSADGFTWWPQDLAQRVWTTPMTAPDNFPGWHLHIETDLVADAADQRDTLETLIWINRSAILSALVLDEGRIRLHAAVAINSGNVPFASDLALHAMALQLVEASFAADTLVSKGCGRRDSSAHPSAGPRKDGDEMLGIGGLYADPELKAPEIDFARLKDSQERCWIAAEYDATSFSAVFNLDTGSSGIVDMVKRQEGQGAALFQATTTETHPAIGPGMLVALRMPDVPLDPRRAANMLNAMARTAPVAHALGAWWYSDEYGVTLSAFYPALAFRKESPERNFRLFESLVWHASATATWARALLVRGKRV